MEINPNTFEVSDGNRVTFNSYVKGYRTPSIYVNIDGEEFEIGDVQFTLFTINLSPKLIFSPLVNKLIEIKALTPYDDDGFTSRGVNFEKLWNRLDKIVAVG